MSTSSITQQQKPKNHVSLALLVLIAFSGTVAMHIFVPALPQAAGSLHSSDQTIKLTITVYILGLAIGQLIYGPISDAVGRRPAVFSALAIYFLGCIAAYFAPSAEFLIGARLLQALGGAGGLALSRVIVADTTEGANATRGLALLNLILLVGPGVAPILGANIAEWFGWRAIFSALAMMAAAAILLSVWGLPETSIPSKNLNIRAIKSDFLALLQNRKFLIPTLGGAFGSTGSYAYFVSAPFILHVDMGLDVQTVGYCVGVTLIAAACGSLLARKLAGRIASRTLLMVSSGIATLTGLVFMMSALMGWLSPVSVVLMSCVVLFSAGCLSPTAMGAALSQAGKRTGSAAGLYGFCQMSSGVICTFLVGLFTDNAFACGLVLSLAYGFSLMQFRRRTI